MRDRTVGGDADPEVSEVSWGGVVTNNSFLLSCRMMAPSGELCPVQREQRVKLKYASITAIRVVIIGNTSMPKENSDKIFCKIAEFQPMLTIQFYLN